MYGTGEEKEIEADSESMSFDEPGVGQNLQKAPASDFANKAAHAQFKAAVAEAQKCLKEGAALSEESEDDAAAVEEEVEAQPQGRTTRKRKEAAPTTSVEGLPDGWVCSTHVTPSGQQYKRYKGPNGGRAQSLKQVWVLHDRAVAKGTVPASSARGSDEQEAAAAKGGEGMPDGWVCSTHVAPSGQQYKRYKGPNGERAQSLKQVWALHDGADPAPSAERGEASAPQPASAVRRPAATSAAASSAAAAAAALPPAPGQPSQMVAPGQPPGQQSLTLEIKIPPGHPPGSQLTCRGPNGVAYTMVVPPDSAEGSKVRFKITPQPAAAPPVLAARHCAPFAGAEAGVQMPLEQLEASQAALRLHGNAAFKEGRHHDALAHYSEALKIDPTCRGAEAHVIHSNLSAVYAAMHEWTAALTHGQVCVSLKPDFAKGYARTGTALAHSGRQAEAVAHFERCLQLEPDNAAVREAMRQAQHTLELMGGAAQHMMPAAMAASVAGQAAAEAWQVAQAVRAHAAGGVGGAMANADRARAAQARSD